MNWLKVQQVENQLWLFNTSCSMPIRLIKIGSPFENSKRGESGFEIWQQLENNRSLKFIERVRILWSQRTLPILYSHVKTYLIYRTIRRFVCKSPNFTHKLKNKEKSKQNHYRLQLDPIWRWVPVRWELVPPAGFSSGDPSS